MLKERLSQNRFLSENGQSLVMVALLMIVFLAFLALVIDGGNAFAMRRAAQNAADAGALAGARTLCKTGNVYEATTTAWDYAVNHNHATEATATRVSVGTIQVVASFQFSTFFGSILGRPQLTASAIAEAGCFAPSTGKGVLPVAWSCRYPSDPDTSGSPDCEMQFMDHDPLPKDNKCTLGEDPVYIVVDSATISDDVLCQDPPNSGLPVGALDCDLNDDGENDLNLLSGGNRSWLDLSGGGGGAADLKDWVINGYDTEVHSHTWFAGQTGVAVSVYDAVKDYQLNHDVVIPVFDQYCDGLPEANCPNDYHPNNDYPDATDTTVVSNGASTDYFHVISFAIFRVTCVEGGSGKDCPAHKAVGLSKSFKTIEGCFVEGFVPGLGGKPADGVDAGAWTLYLTR